MNRNIAIDGPAGSGKSTIAKLIGKKLKLMYINTGAMYRAVTLEALNKGIEAENTEKLSDIINSMEMYFKNDDLYVNNENVSSAITTPHISNNVSKYAAVPLVRKKLVLKMQKMAEEFDVIMDGRDIGTVVLKDASYKFFLIASPEERANRRFKEYKEKNIQIDYNELLDDIKRRDYIDSTRAMDPLRKAEDAVEIDSTHLTIDGVVEKILSYIK